MDQIRVVIADDHAMVRAGLRDWIGREPDIAVIAEAETGREAIRLCEFERPNILIQDLQMPDQSGLDVIRHLRAMRSQVRILALSGLDKHYARPALEAGADGYLCKEERHSTVIEAIRWAVTKTTGSWISPLAANATLSNHEDIKKARLTFSEQEVLKNLKNSNKHIAAQLFIAEGTVKNHVSAIYDKLGIHSRRQAIDWAEERGLIM